MIKNRILQVIHGGLLAIGVLVLLLWPWSYVGYEAVEIRHRIIRRDSILLMG